MDTGHTQEPGLTRPSPWKHVGWVFLELYLELLKAKVMSHMAIFTGPSLPALAGSPLGGHPEKSGHTCSPLWLSWPPSRLFEGEHSFRGEAAAPCAFMGILPWA